LIEEDFKEMLNNKIISHAVKGNTKKDYVEGYVSIGIKEGIKLNPNSYIKRTKILDPDTKS